MNNNVVTPTSIDFGANIVSNENGVITFDGDITNIPDYAFKENDSLVSIILPKTVTRIGDEAFHSCSNLTNVVIPENVEYIGEICFYSCGMLNNVVMSDKVTYVGRRAFNLCTSLTDITLSNNITVIKEFCFKNCYQLSEITIPNQIRVIEHQAFFGTKISYVDLPPSINEIQYDAFPRDSINTIVCRSASAPLLNYFYSEKQTTQTVGRDNYRTLGSAKIYAYNTQTFGKDNSYLYGHWRSYIKNTVTNEFISREIIDINLL